MSATCLKHWVLSGHLQVLPDLFFWNSSLQLLYLSFCQQDLQNSFSVQSEVPELG